MISDRHMLGYDWQAQKRDCPIAADVKPKAAVGEEQSGAPVIIGWDLGVGDRGSVVVMQDGGFLLIF